MEKRSRPDVRMDLPSQSFDALMTMLEREEEYWSSRIPERSENAKTCMDDLMKYSRRYTDRNGDTYVRVPMFSKRAGIIIGHFASSYEMSRDPNRAWSGELEELKSKAKETREKESEAIGEL